MWTTGSLKLSWTLSTSSSSTTSPLEPVQVTLNKTRTPQLTVKARVLLRKMQTKIHKIKTATLLTWLMKLSSTIAKDSKKTWRFQNWTLGRGQTQPKSSPPLSTTRRSFWRWSTQKWGKEAFSQATTFSTLSRVSLSGGELEGKMLTFTLWDESWKLSSPTFWSHPCLWSQTRWPKSSWRSGKNNFRDSCKRLAGVKN